MRLNYDYRRSPYKVTLTFNQTHQNYRLRLFLSYRRRFISNTRIPHVLDKLQISSNKKASHQFCISVLSYVRGLTHLENNLIQTNCLEFLFISPFLFYKSIRIYHNMICFFIFHILCVIIPN